MKKSIFCCALACCFILSSALASEPVKLFEENNGSAGKVHELSPADHNIHPQDGFFYNEAWFMIAISDDGHYGYVTFLVSNSGITAMAPGLSFTIVTPDRKRLVKDVDFEPDDLKMGQDKFSLQLKGNYFRETQNGYDLKVDYDGLGMELSFENQVPGLVVGNGNAVFGSDASDVFYINYPGPRPVFSGKFIIDGKEIPVSGWGYIDHSITGSNPGNFQEVWHNFKFRSDSHTVLISSFTTPQQYERDFSFGVVTDKDKVLCSFTEIKVTEHDAKNDPESGKLYPQRVGYVATGQGCRVSAIIDTSKPAEKFDVLAKLEQKWYGKVVKMAINSFIAEPWYYRCVEPVVVEITVDRVTNKVSGTAFNEIIFTD